MNKERQIQLAGERRSIVGCSSRNLWSAAVVIAGGERLQISHCCNVGRLAGTPAEAKTRTASAWLRLLASRQDLRRRMIGAGALCEVDVSCCSERNLSSAAEVTAWGEVRDLSHC